MRAPSRLMLTTRAGSVSSSVAQRAPTTSSRTRERLSPSAISGSLREENQLLADDVLRQARLRERPGRYCQPCPAPSSDSTLQQVWTRNQTHLAQHSSNARRFPWPVRLPCRASEDRSRLRPASRPDRTPAFEHVFLPPSVGSRQASTPRRE